MSPAEAGQVEFEEPDWRERFEEHCLRWPKLPRYLAEDNAFEATLRDYRRFHWTPIEVKGEQKKLPAGQTEAVIALAKLGILAPRSTWNEIKHGTVVEGFQHDDHCWLSIAGEQWRITAIEDRMLHLEKMCFEGESETRQIDLNRASWEKYTEAAVAVLDAMRAP